MTTHPQGGTARLDDVAVMWYAVECQGWASVLACRQYQRTPEYKSNGGGGGGGVLFVHGGGAASIGTLLLGAL